MTIDLGKPFVWIIAGIVAIVWWLSRDEAIAGDADSLLELGAGGGGIATGASLEGPIASAPANAVTDDSDSVQVDSPRPDPRITNGGTIDYGVVDPKGF